MATQFTSVKCAASYCWRHDLDVSISVSRWDLTLI